MNSSDLAQLAVAALAGAACGCALLLQVLLRDIARDNALDSKTRLNRLFVAVRLTAAALTMVLPFMILPRFAPHNGGSELQFWLVIAGVLSVFGLGFRPMQRLAALLLPRITGS